MTPRFLLLVVFTSLSPIALASSEMVNVPEGLYPPFFKGAEVRVPEFSLQAYPVTNEEFLAFVEAHPAWKRSHVGSDRADSGYLEHWRSDDEIGDPRVAKAPVTNVSWYAADAYCKSEGKTLPTVDQWEYADYDRGQGKAASTRKTLSWFSKPTPDVLPPVGSSGKNSLGIYDLNGLIWEWNQDFDSSSVSGTVSAAGNGIVCGSAAASARDPADYTTFMRFAFRSSLKPEYTVFNLGFRCALSRR